MFISETVVSYAYETGVLELYDGEMTLLSGMNGQLA